VDLIKVHDERYGIVLGDVAGKGLRAALLMVKLQATLRALVPDFSSLSALAAKLNEIFCRDSLRSMFASMVYAEFRPGSGEIRLLNAGHLPPVVVVAGNVESLAKGGPALGIAPGATFAEQTMTLGKQDMLCLYSDGLTEAENVNGEFFGEQRLLRFLAQHRGRPLDEVGTDIVAAADRFIGEAGSRDDVSLALIRRTL
jgi:sigma-B regulation protein RsbU (phosphoserine phosphatase)